ncbi:MAG: hypothetical protein J6038_04280, partial [Bacilli bacterium]|nr:hypothetical protein [Bacilli bacterium]
MNDKMLRFLRSIKIENPERFDLDFDLCSRDLFNPKILDMEIVKDSPWSPDDLAEFKAGLENIEYQYYMRFSYRSDITPSDVIALYDGWYFSSYRKNPPYHLKEGKGDELYIYFPSVEAKDEHAKKTREFNSFLKWLCYSYNVVAKVDESLLESKEAPKEAAQKEEPRVAEIELPPMEEEIPDAAINEEFAPRMEEVEEVLSSSPLEEGEGEEQPSFEEAKEEETPTEENIRESEEEKHERELLEAQMEIARKMQENQKLMEEERNRQRVFKRGDYHPVERIKNIFSMPLENVDFTGSLFSIDSRTTRNGKSIYTFGFHDDTSAIYVTCFSNSKSMTPETLGSFKVGDRIRIRGSIDISKFSKEREIIAHFLDILPPLPEREDPLLHLRESYLVRYRLEHLRLRAVCFRRIIPKSPRRRRDLWYHTGHE